MTVSRPFSVAARDLYIAIVFTICAAIASTNARDIFVAASIGLACDAARYIGRKTGLIPLIGLPSEDARIADAAFVRSHSKTYFTAVYGSLAIVVAHSIIYAVLAAPEGHHQNGIMAYLECVRSTEILSLSHIERYAQVLSQGMYPDRAVVLVAFTQQSFFLAASLFVGTITCLGDTEAFLFRSRGYQRRNTRKRHEMSLLCAMLVFFLMTCIGFVVVNIPDEGYGGFFYESPDDNIIYCEYAVLNFGMFLLSYEVYSMLVLRCAGIDRVRPPYVDPSRQIDCQRG